MNNICVFEDDQYNDLLPLTFSRPTYDLFIGMDSLLDKIMSFFDYAITTLHCRDYLEPLVKYHHKKMPVNKITSGMPCLFINGRTLMTSDLHHTLVSADTDHDLLFTHQGHVVALYLRGDLITSMRNMLKKVPSSEEIISYFRSKCVAKELTNVTLIQHPWDLIYLNDTVIRSDFKHRQTPGVIKGNIGPMVTIYNENNVFIDQNTTIEDFVVLDAKNGPIYIEDHVTITAHSRLQGPLYIGNHSHIMGAKLSHTSIGPHCKVGGEVSHSIFHGYSNKAHHGFLGHSYVGEWVNLGSLTTTSNLKINYQSVKVKRGSDVIDTDKQFLGSIIGDHVKNGYWNDVKYGHHYWVWLWSFWKYLA